MPQQKLDEGPNPGQVYDPDSAHPESLEKRNSPKDEAAFDQIAADNRDLESDEQNATTNDGNATATNKSEKGLTSGGGATWATIVSAKKSAKGSNKVKVFIAVFMVMLLMGVGGVVFLLPGLAVKSVMAKSTEFFMDRISYTTERRVERLIGGYFVKMVTGPGGSMERCGTYISANCYAVDSGKGIAGNLYKNWSEARLEERLNKRYGLEFVKNTQTNQIEVFKTNAAGIRGQVGVYGDNTVAKEISGLVKNETRWQQVRDRRGLRSLLSERYGAKKWCFIWCEKKDSLDQVKINALTKAKLRIAARVLSPINAKQTAIILCLISDCSDTETNQAMREAAKDALGGTDENLAEAVREINGVDVNDVDAPKIGVQKRNSISEYYLKKFITKVLLNFMEKTAAEAAAAYVPIVGQIYAGATIADLYDSLDQKIEDKEISKYLRDINESAYVDYFSIMQASSDEVFSGGAALEDVGAMSTILSGSNKSRVYQKANNSSKLSTVECDDGVVLSGPTDPLACPEKAVQPKIFIEEWRQNSIVRSIQPLVNAYGTCLTPDVPIVGCLRPKTVIKPALEAISWVTSGAASFALSTVEKIPKVGDFIKDAQAFVADKAGELIGFIAEKTFKNVINPEAEGQEAFDQLAAGMDVSANSFAKGDTTETGEVIGMGGTRLTEQQEVALAEAISEQKKEDRKEESLFARYFDINSHDSLLASSAVAISQGVTDKQSFGSMFSLSSISDIFKNLLPSERSYANGISNRQEVFGVYQYGYAEDDASQDIDPEELTVERCAEFARIREETAEVDPETKQKIYTTSNPCLLDELLVDSLTKVFNLDPDSARYADGTTGSSSTSIVAQGLNGYAIPCEGLPRTVTRFSDAANWEGVPDSGVIGTGSTGKPIKVYIREACEPANARTLIIGSSIHGSENGGQLVSHELLFNAQLPPDVRVIAIPEINGFGIPTSTRKNANGVDLNRNYDFRWETLTKTENLSPSGKNYRGVSAESEPETKAVVAFLKSIGSSSLFISYHDNINWVAPVGNTPFGIAQSYSNSTGMSIGNDLGQYVTQRGSMDAWYNAETGSPTLLVELTNERSTQYINSHVEAVRRLFNENVVQ